jgi:hypothetical protein
MFHTEFVNVFIISLKMSMSNYCELTVYKNILHCCCVVIFHFSICLTQSCKQPTNHHAKLEKHPLNGSNGHMKNGVFWDVTPCGSLRTDVSEELSASFIGVTRIGELGTLAVTSY